MSNIYRKNINLLKKLIPKPYAITFFQQLTKDAHKEDDEGVASVWRNLYNKVFGVSSKNSIKLTTAQPVKGIEWDSFLVPNRNITELVKPKLKMLSEFKQESEYPESSSDLRNLTTCENRARTLAQALGYINLIINGKHALDVPVPNVIILADNAEAVVFQSKYFIKKYIDSSSPLHKKFNWSISPRKMFYGQNPSDSKLADVLSQDRHVKNVVPFLFDQVNNNFNLDLKASYKDLLNMFLTIENYGMNPEDRIKITINTHNILNFYHKFKKIAFAKNQANNVCSADLANAFVHILTNGYDKNHYIAPFTKGSKFQINYSDRAHVVINLNGGMVNAFLSNYNCDFNEDQIDTIISMEDRLIEMDARRSSGDFWTPKSLVKKADAYMQSVIGSDYRQKCLVWDCGAGTSNLTRPFPYAHLNVSTLYPAEIDAGKKFNLDAESDFAYDFLNDDVTKNPYDVSGRFWTMCKNGGKNLFNSLLRIGKAGKKGMPVVFYTNPPYATASNNRIDSSSKVTSGSGSAVNRLMRENKLGRASGQSYAQFIYRAMLIIKNFKIKNAYICFFTKPQFMNGGAYWHKFNNKFLTEYKWIKGFIANAGEFSGTKSTWPITFSIFKLKDHASAPQQNFNMTILSPKDNRKIGVHTEHIVYTKDALTNWYKKNHQDASHHLSNAMGYLTLVANDVRAKNRSTWISNQSSYKAHLTPKNISLLRKPTSHFNNLLSSALIFATRECTPHVWYNDSDNFMYPHFKNMTKKQLNTFLSNCLTYMIFSRRNLVMSDDQHSNLMFWMSPADIIHGMKVKSVKDTNGQIHHLDTAIAPMYEDVKKASIPTMYNVLNHYTLSKSAQAVLKDASSIWWKTLYQRYKQGLDSRNKYNNGGYTKRNPHRYDRFLVKWDASWLQLKYIHGLKKSKDYHHFMSNLHDLKADIFDGVKKLDMIADPKGAHIIRSHRGKEAVQSSLNL